MSELPEIPGFQLERLLGSGAYGRVYLARETGGLARPVALKVFAPQAHAAWEKELEALQRVEELRRQGRHPGIVQALTTGEHAGQGWIALEYLEAGTLRQRVEGEGPLPWQVALGYVSQAAAGVQVLHEAGLFHRDLKPSNLLLGADDRVRVGDFGLTRELDGTLSAAGSPAFAPPELIAGQVDAAQRAQVDVYGLGATLYYLLVGQAARPGRPDAFALERQGVPRPGVELLLEAMAYEPEERPGDAGALLLRLQALTGIQDSGRASSGLPEGGAEEGEPMKSKSNPVAPPVVRSDLPVEVERPRCPYCHDAVAPEDTKRACESCMAWHHGACWAESRQCAACGARSAQEQPLPRRPRVSTGTTLLRLVALVLGVLMTLGFGMFALLRKRAAAEQMMARDAEPNADLTVVQPDAADDPAPADATPKIDPVSEPSAGDPARPIMPVELGQAVTGELAAGETAPWFRLAAPPAGETRSFLVFLEAPEQAEFSLLVCSGADPTQPPADPDEGGAMRASGKSCWAERAWDETVWLRVSARKGQGAFRLLLVEDVLAQSRAGTFTPTAIEADGTPHEGRVEESGATWLVIDTGQAKSLALHLSGPQVGAQELLVLPGNAKEGRPVLTSTFWSASGPGSTKDLPVGPVYWGRRYVRVFGSPGAFELTATPGD